MKFVNKFLKSNKKFIYGFNKKILALKRYNHYLIINNKNNFNNTLINWIKKNKYDKIILILKKK